VPTASVSSFWAFFITSGCCIISAIAHSTVVEVVSVPPTTMSCRCRRHHKRKEKKALLEILGKERKKNKRPSWECYVSTSMYMII
jgi:hypothetical protein